MRSGVERERESVGGAHTRGTCSFTLLGCSRCREGTLIRICSYQAIATTVELEKPVPLYTLRDTEDRQRRRETTIYSDEIHSPGGM